MGVNTDMGHSICVEVRGRLGVGSILLPCGSQDQIQVIRLGCCGAMVWYPVKICHLISFNKVLIGK